MNETKQKQLFAAARICAPAEPAWNFAARVLNDMRKNERSEGAVSFFDQLGLLFPRLAMAALVVIVVALAFQFFGADDIVTQLADASDEWLLPLNWL